MANRALWMTTGTGRVFLFHQVHHASPHYPPSRQWCESLEDERETHAKGRGEEGGEEEVVQEEWVQDEEAGPEEGTEHFQTRGCTFS